MVGISGMAGSGMAGSGIAGSGMDGSSIGFGAATDLNWIGCGATIDFNSTNGDGLTQSAYLIAGTTGAVNTVGVATYGEGATKRTADDATRGADTNGNADGAITASETSGNAGGATNVSGTIGRPSVL